MTKQVEISLGSRQEWINSSHFWIRNSSNVFSHNSLSFVIYDEGMLDLNNFSKNVVNNLLGSSSKWLSKSCSHACLCLYPSYTHRQAPSLILYQPKCKLLITHRSDRECDRVGNLRIYSSQEEKSYRGFSLAVSDITYCLSQLTG